MGKNKSLKRAFSQLDTTKKDKDYLIPAMLGFMINGVQTVEITSRPGYVYARIRSNTNEVVQVFNDKVSPVYDLPVLLIRDPNNPTRYKVDGRDTGRYENWGTASSFLPRHGDQHSFSTENGGGGDIVWVYSQQVVPWLVSPSGTFGSAGVVIHGHPHYDGGWLYYGGTGTSSIVTYKPTGSSSRMVLVYLDDVGNPSLLAGSYFDATITGSQSILPYIPAAPTNTSIPLGAVRLVSGTSSILWDNIYDIRPFFAGGGGASAGHVIQDDGVSKTARTNLNFVGPAFSVYDDSGNDATIVSGSYSNVNADTLDGLHISDLYGHYIRLWDDSAGIIRKYTADEAGLNSAVSIMGSYDILWIPGLTITLTAGITIPGSTFVIGTDIQKSLLYLTTAGTTVTLGVACSMYNLRVISDGNSASTSCIAISSALNCILTNVIAYSSNINVSGTSYALYGGSTTNCNFTKLGSQNLSGYITPYNVRPLGLFLVNNSNTSYKLMSDNARFGTDTNYVELSNSGLLVSGSARVHINYSGYNSANPPSLADLNSAFGSAAVVGVGFTGLLNDNSGGTDEYLCTSDGTNWFFATLTKAT